MTVPPLQVLIVDDEPLARRGIRVRLAAARDVSVVGECGNGREAIAAIRSLQPDLVFLDVQMPGLSGFDVVAAVQPERMPVVVFVTAHDEHAIHAFDVQALDYLLKPIDDERFARTVERARERLAERRDGTLARRMAALLAERDASPAAAPLATGRADARLAVRDRGRIVLVDVADIAWVQAEGDYVRVHVPGRSHLIRETMTAMESRLTPERFARIHRSAIVNVRQIIELRPETNGEFVVVLRDGAQLRSSRSYADRLRSIVGDPL